MKQGPLTSVFIIGGGEVTGLAGGLVSLADLGLRRTRRASRLEFDAAANKWTVTDAATKALLFSHPDYDVALRWERDHFNAVLAQQP